MTFRHGDIVPSYRKKKTKLIDNYHGTKRQRIITKIGIFTFIKYMNGDIFLFVTKKISKKKDIIIFLKKINNVKLKSKI